MDWRENSLSTEPQNINVIPVDESYDGVKYFFQFGQISLSIWTHMFDNQTNTLSVKKKKHFLVWTNKFVNLDTLLHQKICDLIMYVNKYKGKGNSNIHMKIWLDISVKADVSHIGDGLQHPCEGPVRDRKLEMFW